MASAGTAYVDVEAKLDEFASQIEAAVSAIDTQTVEVDADVSAAEADLSSLEADPVEVPVGADVASAQSEIDGLEADPLDVKVEADTDAAQQSIDELGDSSGGASDAVDGLSGALGGAGLAGAGWVAAGGVGALAVGVVGMTQSFGEAQAIGAETDSMLASLGSGAVTSADHIGDLSQAIMEYSGFSDEAVQQGANTLLMFDRINSQPVFDRALNDSADLARRLRTDVPTAARMLGMALQDPEAGMNRLRRAGITLSDSQKETVAALMATGDTAGAQEVIFDALEAKIGNLAETYGGTLPGELDKTNEAVDELSESLGNMLAPLVELEAQGLTIIANGITDVVSGTGDYLHAQFVEPFVNLGQGLGIVGDDAASTGRVFDDFGASARNAGSGMDDMAAAADDAGYSVSHLDDRVQAYLDGTFRVPDAERELRDSLSALGDVFADSTHTADDVAAAFEDVAYATAGVGSATGDMGSAVDSAKFGLLALASQAGLSSDEMASLIAVLDVMPGQVEIPVTAPGADEVEGQATRIGNALLGIPPTDIDVTSNAPEVTGDVDNLSGAVDAVPDTPSVMFGDNAPAAQGRVDALSYAATTADGDYFLNFHVSIGDALASLNQLRGQAIDVRNLVNLAGADSGQIGGAVATSAAPPAPTYNVTVHAGSGSDGTLIAQAVSDELRKLERAGR